MKKNETVQQKMFEFFVRFLRVGDAIHNKKRASPSVRVSTRKILRKKITAPVQVTTPTKC